MIRPTIGNLAIVTVMAIVGIWLAKGAMRIFPVRGLSDVIAGV